MCEEVQSVLVGVGRDLWLNHRIVDLFDESDWRDGHGLNLKSGGEFSSVG